MPELTIQQAFDVALQHHQAGRLAEAEAIYRQILVVEPRHADALHLLGMIVHQAGRNDIAVELIRQAIALKPNYPEAHCNLGNAFYDRGQMDEAIACFRQAIALNPNLQEAHNNLGNALCARGQTDEAIGTYRQAIALNPTYPEAHNNFGNALRAAGNLDEAIAAYHQAITLKPNYPEAHSNLGNALKDKGRLDEAIAACRRAIALKTDYPEAHNNLGNALHDKGQMDEAISAYLQAIALRPKYHEAHSNLGNALSATGQLDKAAAAHRHAITLEPKYPEAHCNLGNALYDSGQLDGAIAAYRQAIALNPNLPEGHYNLALALLLRGNLPEGWGEHEWRWKCKDFPSPHRDFTQPLWDGSPLAGRTILLHAEQGFGDALQFIRYLPLVAQRGGRVIIECHPELQRLLQTVAADLPVAAKGQPLPAFNVQCPLLSLPRVFATDLTNIPQNVPYLDANAADAGVWRDRFAAYSSSVKVGLVWAGSRTHKKDRNRSLRLASLAPLAEVPGVRFFSIQKGDAAAGTKAQAQGMELIDVADDLKDFADTAALIANLDLVISVDTAVVHLAGAMAKPVWTLLPFAPDWRWMLNRSDSPWYPTMRLFRQPRIGDWDSVIGEVREQLELMAGSRG